MATFYVLPSRLLVGQSYSDFLANHFPGITWPRRAWPDLAESLVALAQQESDVHIVFREDLAVDADLLEVLTRDFGAESADEIVEVRPAPRLAA